MIREQHNIFIMDILIKTTVKQLLVFVLKYKWKYIYIFNHQSSLCDFLFRFYYILK